MYNKFYITTPIYYATAKPHLGSLYSTLLADVIKRWNMLKGSKTFLLTGTDEHGQKIAIEAQKVGLEPQKFVDSFIENYKNIWKLYHIDYSRFIRTTENEHIKSVQAWLLDLMKKGYIYKDKYEGWYCVSDEAFIAESSIKSVDQSGKDQQPLCPTCNRATTFINEESYFFQLSAFQDKLLKFYKENPNFVVPKERLNEVIKFVESGLKDLSISRTTVKWGIPFPSDDKHITYVWADALLNYITGIGYGNEAKKHEFNFWWPADLQVMGKDILRFHAIYWPAFLMASDLPLPKQLLVHGWIKINNQKMSKSFNNAVDPEPLAEKYGIDQIRYYLSSQLAITQDSEFSIEALERHINTDLVNDLGNLLNRTIVLAYKNDLYKVPKITKWSLEAEALYQDSLFTIKEFTEYMDKFLVHMALSSLWKFIAKVNAFFHANEPWKLASNDLNKFTEVISATCHSLKVIGYLLWPVMPNKAKELLDHLSEDKILDGNVINELKKDWLQAFYLKKGVPLFQKIDLKDEQSTHVNNDSNQTKTIQESSVLNNAKSDITESARNEISIDDFLKVQLMAGTIEQVEEVPKSDKLFKLQVNFGDKNTRQILSGVKKYFKAQDLIGKQAIFVFNLAPRKMLGLESHGMLLTAQNNDSLEIIVPSNIVPNGTILK